MNVVTNGRSEEFLLLHNASAPQRFEYDLSAVSGVKNISLQDNAVHFTNSQGRQMQIEAPWLVESEVAAAPQPVAVALRATVQPQSAASVTASTVKDWLQGPSPKVHWELTYPNGPDKPRLALVINNASKLHYPIVIDPTWVAPNGSLNTARWQHTATLLNNGQVLVAGGFESSDNASASAEFYNPATGTWTATGSLNTARYEHTATLLPNGQVLVAGGQGNSGHLTSAELYSPANGTWTATGSLNTARLRAHRHTLARRPGAGRGGRSEIHFI